MARWQKDVGEAFMYLFDTNTRYPTIPEGGTTTVAGNSIFATSGDRDVHIIGYAGSHTAAATLTIADHDGTTLAAGIDLSGGKEGALDIKSNNGLRASVTAGTCVVRYRPLIKRRSQSARQIHGYPAGAPLDQ